MSDSFTFDGVSSASCLARVLPTDSMSRAPARNTNVVTVPGRSGALLMDLAAYDNVSREYDVIIAGDADFAALNALRNQLASRGGYRRLTDTFDPTHYFMAAYTEAFSMSADWHSKKRARGTISFNCKPQRYLLSGETAITFTASGSVVNPTRFTAKPFLRVYGTGVVGVGGTNITISSHGFSYIDIDCESGRAYCGATALDSVVALNTIDYPGLAPGANGISKGNGITRIILTPRWWEL